MVITDPILFKVEEFAKNITVKTDVRMYDVPGAWFKNIDSNHEKSGFQFIFPLKHPDYSDGLQERLLQLEVGDTIYIQAESTNKKRTTWKVHSYTEDDTSAL